MNLGRHKESRDFAAARLKSLETYAVLRFHIRSFDMQAQSFGPLLHTFHTCDVPLTRVARFADRFHMFISLSIMQGACNPMAFKPWTYSQHTLPRIWTHSTYFAKHHMLDYDVCSLNDIWYLY